MDVHIDSIFERKGEADGVVMEIFPPLIVITAGVDVNEVLSRCAVLVDIQQKADIQLGVRWKEEAGHTAVNTHCCSVDFLCDITSDHIVLILQYFNVVDVAGQP